MGIINSRVRNLWLLGCTWRADANIPAEGGGGGLRHLVYFLHQLSYPILSLNSEGSVQDAPPAHPTLPRPGSGRHQPTYLGSGTKKRLARLEDAAQSATRGPATDEREVYTTRARGGGDGDGDFISGAHQPAEGILQAHCRQAHLVCSLDGEECQ